MTVLEAAADDRRRHADQRAHASRACCTTTARPCTRWRSARRFLRSLDLERHGLEWRWPEVDLAHPLDDGSAGGDAALDRRDRGRPRRATARAGSGCSAPARALRRAQRGPGAADPARAAPPAAPGALRAAGGGPGDRCWRARSRLAQARALFGGVAAHAVSPLTRPMSSAVGMALIYRLPRLRLAGRPRRLALDHRRAGRRCCASTAARSRPAGAVTSLSELPDADAVVFDLAPGAVARIAGERLPRRVARAYRRYRHGPGAFKVDLAVEGGVPWAQRGRAQGRHGARDRPVRGARRRRARRQPRPHARAAVRAGRASSTSPTPSARPATCTRSGPTRTCRAATTATPSRGGDRPDRALRARPPRADRRDRSVRARRPSCRAQRQLRRRRHHHRRQHDPCQILIRPRLALDPYCDRDPRPLHLLGGDAARRRRPRDERLQRRRSRCCARSPERRSALRAA